MARHLHEVAEAKMDKDGLEIQKGCKLEDVGSHGVSDCHEVSIFLHIFVGFWMGNTLESPPDPTKIPSNPGPIARVLLTKSPFCQIQAENADLRVKTSAQTGERLGSGCFEKHGTCF